MFSANTLLNNDKFIVIHGKYYKKNIKCKKCFKYYKIHEEKRTDVNIAVEIMRDCMLEKVDNLFLVSADSDLVTTIEFVQDSFPQKSIRICFPTCRKSSDIIDTVGSVIYFKTNISKFHKSIMPHRVSNGIKSVTIPQDWIVYPFSAFPKTL